jgi:Raf kinase inhibitor-like YbhB/YbcL family protein
VCEYIERHKSLNEAMAIVWPDLKAGSPWASMACCFLADSSNAHSLLLIFGGLMKRILFVGISAITMFVIALGAMAQQPPSGPVGTQPPARGGMSKIPQIILTSPSFEDGGIIPAKFTMQAAVSPELKWTPTPAGTKSFVILMHDAEGAIQGSATDVTHWLVWNIPGDAAGLPEGVPQGAELPNGSRQVSLHSNGYMGPAALSTWPYHHYTFELFALDTKIDVPAAAPKDCTATRAAVMKAIDGHVLAKAVLVSRFHQ